MEDKSQEYYDDLRRFTHCYKKEADLTCNKSILNYCDIPAQNSKLNYSYILGAEKAWDIAHQFIKDLFNPEMESEDIQKKYGINAKWGDSLTDALFSSNPVKVIEHFENNQKTLWICPGEIIATPDGKRYKCISFDIIDKDNISVYVKEETEEDG